MALKTWLKTRFFERLSSNKTRPRYGESSEDARNNNQDSEDAVRLLSDVESLYSFVSRKKFIIGEVKPK